MAQRSFKTDESFLEKLAIGAVGTQKVIENLTQQGHTPVELERGSTGYKIWKALENDKVIQEKPKGSQEGFESRLTWPSSVASSDGKVTEISNRIKFKRSSDKRTISLALSKKGISLTPCVTAEEEIKRYQILASVVPVSKEVPTREIDLPFYYLNMLTSASISERYGAAKACSFLVGHFDENPLTERINDSDEHIYVKLEAAAALARSNFQIGYDFIESVLNSDYLEHRLEAIIILGELFSERAGQLLIQVLSDDSHYEEIRAGAAWALGELNLKSTIPSLVSAFNEMILPVRIEAARSLRKMCSSHVEEILDFFKNASENERPGVSWALGRYGQWNLNELIDRIDLENVDMRQWGAYIIGNSDQNRIINDIESLKQTDPQLYFAITVLWKITSSWVYQLKEY